MVSSLLAVDSQRFYTVFSRSALEVRHTLAGHPLFTLDAIADLADTLPPASIERNLATHLSMVTPNGAPQLNGRPSDTVRTIERNGCWMVLWYIDRHPQYRTILDACLDEVLPYVPRPEGRMCRREAFLFLSAPGSVTPVHIDPEHNFLLQIRGWKDITVVKFADRGAEMRELNRHYSGGHRNLTAMPTGPAETLRLVPGAGVYVPPLVPHCVKNGNEVSVSLSITFRTELSQRAEHVHTFNAALRRLRLPARPPGTYAPVDWVKAGTVVTWNGARRLGRRIGMHGRGRRG